MSDPSHRINLKRYFLFALTFALSVHTAVRAEDETATSAATPTGPIEKTGELAGAPYLISIPESWNGGLIMYAHGYEAVTPGRRNDFSRSMIKVAHNLGYAVAMSKYSVQGWAAREGVLETDLLRNHFRAEYGATWPTLIAGHSQGGAITFKTIETFPEVYDGALPMCSVAEPALTFFKEQVFDTRLLFDYFFPGLPGSVVDFPGGRQEMVKTGLSITKLIKDRPEDAAAFAKLTGIPDVASIAPVVAFWTEILREMQIRTGGNAFDNTSTIYEGSADDAKLNREIPRHKADPKAVEYLSRWVTPTGRISDPVIHVHTIVDQLIPARRANYYERLTASAGTSDHYVQYFVDRVGHCLMNEAEMTEALRRLDHWIRSGERPEPGDLTIHPEQKSGE